MKIVFVSSARYPTEKAYGVTIGETAKAANEIGHESMILTLGSSGIDEYGNRYLGIANHIYAAIENIKVIKWHVFRKYLFSVKSAIFSIHVFFSPKGKAAEIIWTRDIYIALINAIFTKGKKSVLLEIHHPPRGATKFLLFAVSLSKRNYISTISEWHRTELLKILPEIPILLTPMAVPKSYFSLTGVNSFPKASNISICYLGKSQSSGFDNGLDSLLKSISSLIKMNSNFSFTFIGLEEPAVVNLKNLSIELQIPSTRIEFISHVSHTEVPSILENYDFGILPYSENRYNDARFPIKLLEYAACEIAIIATDTLRNRSILGTDKALFYNPEFEFDLVRTVLLALSRKSETKSQIERAKKWASEFTYEKRVNIVIESMRTEVN